MQSLEPLITKQLRPAPVGVPEGTPQQVLYVLTWSALTQVDKYRISTAVPAVSGVYELYYMDEARALNLLTAAHAWYGGLRGNVRAAVDPHETADPARRALLTDATLYYRYSVSHSRDDMCDLVWFLHTQYFPGSVRVQHSGRYSAIFVQERAPDRVYWLEDLLHRTERGSMQTRVSK